VSNRLIAFAAKAGLTALDGNSKNSPYAAALVKYIAKPGLDLRRAFGFVRDDVLQATGNRQEPYVYGSLGGEDVALIPAPKAEEPTPAANPQSEVRRDYELALQVGNKAALGAFLAQHPEGYYASLAKLRLNQIDAEDARVAATEKARQAEQQQAGIVSEGAQRADQEKAAADLKAAEETHIAAERTKQAALEQAAEAEQKRNASETSAAGMLSGNKPAKGREGRRPEHRAARGRSRQVSTKRIESRWLFHRCRRWRMECGSQRSLALFNRHAGTKLDVKLASFDALDAIKLKPSRVCPLICEHGYRPDGDQCIKITCAEGSFLNNDNECEKRREKKPVATRDRPKAKQVIARRSQAATSAPTTTGRPLTGDERLWGCNSNQAIMSGKCP